MQDKLANLEKHYAIEWRDYKIGKLFDIDNLWVYGKNKQYRSRLEVPTKNSIPIISGITINNGVNYYSEDEIPKEEVFSDCLTISTRGEYSGTVTYHEGKFALANNILVICTPNWNKNGKLYLASLISKLGYGGYSGYPRKETLKRDEIILPTQNGEIAFDYMEAFIQTLEAERLQTLEAYLLATGLKDYQLTEAEAESLERLSRQKVHFSKFNVIDKFLVKNTHNILSRDIVVNNGKIPYLTASQSNNSVGTFIQYDQEKVEQGNSIFIGGKTFVVTYQENDYFSNDSHNLALYLKDTTKNTKENQLFLVSCIYKALSSKYSWGDSISNKKIQQDTFSVPVKENGEPDYDFMTTLIHAMQKVVIQEVVKWTDRKIKATEEIINN